MANGELESERTREKETDRNREKERRRERKRQRERDLEKWKSMISRFCSPFTQWRWRSHEMPQPQSQQLFRTSRDRTSAISREFSRDSVPCLTIATRGISSPTEFVCFFALFWSFTIVASRFLACRRRTGPVVLAREMPREITGRKYTRCLIGRDVSTGCIRFSLQRDTIIVDSHILKLE